MDTARGGPPPPDGTHSPLIAYHPPTRPPFPLRRRQDPADPAADALTLEGLARWADRFTPRVMPDRVDTLFLDIAGCDRLFGGEEALMASLRAGFEDFGLTARLALTDTPGAAWALAH